jgi:hypothetical protein
MRRKCGSAACSPARLQQDMAEDDVLVRQDEKSAGPRGRIAERVIGRRPHHVHDGLDEFAGREVLPGPLWHVFGGTGKQSFIDVAFHVRLHRGPFFFVDQIRDEAPEQGGILKLDLGPLEDGAEHPRFAGQLFEDVAIVGQERFAIEGHEARDQSSPFGTMGLRL